MPVQRRISRDPRQPLPVPEAAGYRRAGGRIERPLVQQPLETLQNPAAATVLRHNHALDNQRRYRAASDKADAPVTGQRASDDPVRTQPGKATGEAKPAKGQLAKSEV